MSLSSIDLGPTGTVQPTRAALFVDFDNVYIGLQKLDAAAAERFATNPGLWTDAMASGGGTDGTARRFLIRNCYLNPSAFSKYRAYWTRAGYRVIDCPSLTQQGKSSTDINLVLDAMDILGGPGRIEEFFLASADADFTSLIQRFRAADRFTTVIVAGSVASAYRSTADQVVESDEFVSILNEQSGSLPATGNTSVEIESPAAIDPTALSARDEQTSGARRLAVTRNAEAGLDGPRTVPETVQGAVLAKQQATIEQQVTRVTDVPTLSTAQFKQLFTSLESRLNGQAFNRTETTKQVRDDCAEAGVPVSRSAINFVITGLLYAGVPLTSNVTAKTLATGWAKNVEALCRGARMEFDESEKVDLRMWVSGGLAT